MALMPRENTLAPMAQWANSVLGMAGRTSAKVGRGERVSRSGMTPSASTALWVCVSNSRVRIW